MKKIIAILCLITVFASSAFSIEAKASEASTEQIQTVCQLGIMDENEDGEYDLTEFVTRAEFAEMVNTMQEIYDMDPGALWWSANQTVLTAAENGKRALDKQKKFMTPEQSAKYEKLAKQYNRLIHS